MTHRALRACASHGCPNVTSERYCAQHRHLTKTLTRLNESTRPTSRERGYGHAWRRYTEGFKRSHPVCCDPFRRHPGQTRATYQVDHITPHKGDQTLFWDKINHQPLCASCGGYKSATEVGGWAHRDRPELPPVSGMVGVQSGNTLLPQQPGGSGRERLAREAREATKGPSHRSTQSTAETSLGASLHTPRGLSAPFAPASGPPR